VAADLPCYRSHVPDDEGRRRRLGDETKNRIADLASGWSLDGPDEPLAPVVPAHTPKPVESNRGSSPSQPPLIIESTRGASPSKPLPTAGEPARGKPRTSPPPPPGSAARRALEDKDPSRAVTSEHASSASGRISSPIVPGTTSRTTSPSEKPDASEVPVTAAPSEAVTRAASSSTGRAGPQYKRAGYQGPAAPFEVENKTFATEAHTPAVIVDETLSGPIKAIAVASNAVPPESSTPAAAAPPSRPRRPTPAPPLRPTPPPLHPPPDAKPAMPLPAPNDSSGRGLKVPVGEFDSGVQTIEQSTFARDAAALLQLPETPVEDLLDDDDSTSQPRGDATMIDPQTAKFSRGDPTNASGVGGTADATQIHESARLRHQSGGTLRPSAALRRKRGLAGDVRYVFTVLFGVRTSRRELGELEHRQSLRQTSRRRHLITLGRAAVITDSFDHPALGKARDQLQAIEDERSRHAGAVSASDAELERVRRDRDAKATQYIADLAATDAELADLAKKLEPVEKEAASARKRASELREALQRIDKKIADTEALLASAKADKLDRAAVQADIATYKADRQAVLRDEPVLAAELDALDPRIAAMESARAELRRKRAELEKAEVDDKRRTAELLDAIGAKRKVVERAAADAEAARDSALFELGERLYVDRPNVLTAQLSPIDQIDLEVGEGDRRIMELKEILSNVDKAKLARGLAMIILVLGVVGSLALIASAAT
jgi:predicted  nucleic acid-binding Zn-ribbon protein